MKPSKIPGIEALSARDGRWYLPEFEEVRANKLTTVANAIRRHGDYARQHNYHRYASLYSNTPLLGLTPQKYSQSMADLSKDRLSLNVIRSCADSFVAKLTNERPQVSCLTSGGDYDLQQRASNLERFVSGQFYETDLYETAQLVALDSAVLGTGVLKIYSDDDGEAEHIVLERVPPTDIFCDEVEAYRGNPRSMYQYLYCDRLQAMAMWPDCAEELAVLPKDSQEENEGGQVRENTYTDSVCIVEGWHLPSRANANDGRHTIACGDLLLFDEPWTKSYFPFVFLYRQRPQLGIWGAGLAEELQGIQLEIGILLNMIRKAMRMSGSVRWLLETGSNVNSQQINDIIGGLIRYTGTPPQPITPPAIAPEVYQHLDRLYGKAFEITGISQLSAQSQKPAGLNSGKALQTYTDIESERFSVAYHEYQSFFLKVARQVIALAREIGDRNKKFRVKTADKGRMMEVVDWADIHLTEEEYVLRLVPTNSFSKDPAAKLQQIQDLANSGLLDPKTARRLMDGIPDLDAEDNLEFASYKLTMSMITAILKDGRFQPPEPFLELQDSIKRFTLAYCSARESGVEEEKLELLRRWIQMANDMSQPPPPPPGAPPGAPPGPPPPGAPPGPPPGAAPPMAA